MVVMCAIKVTDFCLYIDAMMTSLEPVGHIKSIASLVSANGPPAA